MKLNGCLRGYTKHSDILIKLQQEEWENRVGFLFETNPSSL
jgi:hypothetical protein